MPVSNYATRAGKQYESDLMKLMREDGRDVERLRLTGAEDEGDLLLRVGYKGKNVADRFVIEAKRRKTLDLAGWVREAEVERDNYVAHRNHYAPVGFVVVHHARGKNIRQSYVTTTLEEWLSRL